MTAQQWVIGCEYITLQMLCHLLRSLRRWLSNTILIKLTYAKMQLTYVLKKSLEKNKKLELYSSGGVCHICRDKREEHQRCSCNDAFEMVPLQLKCDG